MFQIFSLKVVGQKLFLLPSWTEFEPDVKFVIAKEKLIMHIS